MLQTRVGAGAWTSYLYGHERLASLASPRAWYFTDALGTLRRTISDAGAIQGTAAYSAWGVPQGSLIAPFGFTGEIQSGAGLTYLRARWYNATSGRFGSRDPYAGDIQQPYSLHSYQYGFSDPVGKTDRSGWQVEDTIIDRDDLEQCSESESSGVAGCYTIPDEKRYGKRIILGIILHDTGFERDTCEGVINWWASNTVNTSAHYLVGYTGEIYRTVPDAAIAHHAGGSRNDPSLATFYVQAEQRYRTFGGFALNRVTLGIEVLGRSGRFEAEYPQGQRDAVVALVRYLAREYDILPINIQSHDEVQKGKTDGEGLKQLVRDAVRRDRQQNQPPNPTAPGPL